MFKYKVVLLGNSGVGKSNICIRLMNNNFNISENSTIGAQFFCYKIMIKDKEIPLQIWDTAGHERFKSLLPLYLRHSMFIIVVIDVSINIESQLESWMNYINVNQHFFDKNHTVIIVFNKIDLLTENNKINLLIENNKINLLTENNKIDLLTENIIIPSADDIHIKYNINLNNILKISCKTNLGFIELKNCLIYNTQKIYDINTDSYNNSLLNNTQNIVLNESESNKSESNKSESNKSESNKSLLDYIQKINILKNNCY
jgi:small GTP-binding protein